MLLAEAAPGGPVWLSVVTVASGLMVALIAARSPVWVERAKARFGKPAEKPVVPPPSAEAVLREWLATTQKDRDRLAKRVDRLEAELYRRGWDGRTL